MASQAIVYVAIIIVFLLIALLFDLFSLKNVVELYVNPVKCEKRCKSEKNAVKSDFLRVLRYWTLVSNSLSLVRISQDVRKSEEEGLVYDPYPDFIKAKKFATIVIPVLSIFLLILIFPLTSGSFDMLLIILPLALINIHVYIKYHLIMKPLNIAMKRRRKPQNLPR